MIASAFAGPIEDADRAIKEKRFSDAYQLLLPEAKKGNSFAQYNVAFFLSNGLGVKKDEREAFKWYEKAALQGDTDSQTNLGSMYEKGSGVDKDLKKALSWYERAAEKGNAMARNNLGGAYLAGRGVEQDNQKALKWLAMAAEQGVPEAQNSLAIMHFEGRGVPKDPAQGNKWLQLAAAQGFEPAQTNVFKLTLDMASAGNVDAMHNIGGYYLKGFGVKADPKEGIQWITKAANSGRKESQKILFQLYEKGTYGVERDEKQAHSWKQKYEN